MNDEEKERRRRARAHLRAAKRYAAEGNAAKARAHFGRAKHYYGSEFGGLTDMLAAPVRWLWQGAPTSVDDLQIKKSWHVDYSFRDPREPGSMWMCPKCGCVEVVIYAENTGVHCVAPMCTGTRGKAKDAYKYQSMYKQMYQVQSMLDNRLRVFSSDRLINDVPEVTVPRVPTGNGETQVPDPNKTYAPWICQEYNSRHDACNTIHLLLRVPNKEDWCANPRCTGERADAVEAVEAARAYGDNLEEYKAKFAAAVEAVRLVVRHNEPLATSLAEKRAKHRPVTVREIAEDNQSAMQTAHLGHIQKQREASFIGFVVPEVPRLVKECVDELMRRVRVAATFPQGLFRVPGNDSNVKTLLRAYQENRPVVLEQEATNDIAGLLKRFFMQLQTPLLGSKHEKLEDLAELSDGHKLVLRYILPLLRAIANTKESLLDAQRLATSIACIAEKTETQKTQEDAALARSETLSSSASLEEAAAIKRRSSFIARVISESADVDAILNMTTI
jgi:hypothetical protein